MNFYLAQVDRQLGSLANSMNTESLKRQNFKGKIGELNGKGQSYKMKKLCCNLLNTFILQIREEIMEDFTVFLDDEEKTVVANDLDSVLEILEGHGYIVEKKEG